jgi:hypothetical protein
MMRPFVGVLALVALVTSVTMRAGAEDYITPSQAIEKAAAAAPQGVSGTFAMSVRGSGEAQGNIFLNSESDYHDRSNLTVVISPFVRAALTKKYGAPPESYFLGKRILVTGEAKRTTIWLYAHGLQTSDYYYQTHIVLTDASQVQITGAPQS